MTQVIPNGSGYRIGLLVGYNHWMDGSILDFTKFPASAANNIGQYPTVAITKSNYETWMSVFLLGISLNDAPFSDLNQEKL